MRYTVGLAIKLLHRGRGGARPSQMKHRVWEGPPPCGPRQSHFGGGYSVCINNAHNLSEYGIISKFIGGLKFTSRCDQTH